MAVGEEDVEAGEDISGDCCKGTGEGKVVEGRIGWGRYGDLQGVQV